MALAVRPFASIRQSSKVNSWVCNWLNALSSARPFTVGQIAATASASSAAKAER
jgi:hypothetical protein